MKNLWWNDWNLKLRSCKLSKVEIVKWICITNHSFIFSSSPHYILCIYYIKMWGYVFFVTLSLASKLGHRRPVEDCNKYSYCSLLTYHWQGLFVCSLWELTVHSSQCRAVFLWPNDHKVILHLSSCRFWIFKNDFV